jgi:hypothetical protein
MSHVTEANQEVRMDYIAESKKFIWRAQEAVHPGEEKAHRKMAEWCLSRAPKGRKGS